MKDRVDLLWLRGERRWYDGAWEVPPEITSNRKTQNGHSLHLHSCHCEAFTPILQGPTGQR